MECARRTIAGLGNGNLSDYDIARPIGQWFGKNQDGHRIIAQGVSNSDAVYAQGSSTANLYKSAMHSDYDTSLKGLYQITKTTQGAHALNEQCYFLVCGTVNRLNQGAYHPSFNPQGTQFAASMSNGAQLYWHDDSVSYTSSADCFSVLPDTSSGHIASTTSGRPDGRFYDAIYASGQGGVCRDMRYLASGLSLADLAVADLKVKSGQYRGVESLRLTAFCKVIEIINSDANYSIFRVDRPHPFYLGAQVDGGLDNGTKPFGHAQNLFIYNVADRRIEKTSSYDASFASSYGTNYNGKTVARCFGGYQPKVGDIILSMRGIEGLNDIGFTTMHTSTKMSVSVAGDYMHIDVIGEPQNILQCEDFKNGWIGGWISKVPDNSTGYQLTQPCISSYTRIYTTDNGATWQSLTPTIDAVLNEDTGSINVNVVAIQPYKTKAKVTVPSNNGVIHKAHAGIGGVYLTQNYLERDLCFSLTNKVIVRSSHARSESTALLKDFGRLYLGAFFPTSPRHFDFPPAFPLPDNNSSGLKALNYAVEQNGQAFINYAFAELHYDSVANNWGCEGNIPIANGLNTMLDTNGDTVVFGTAQTVEALGWIRCDA
ncbi:hypothetical protein A7985_08910 [Pseudoalteromonas luteoviolacea]|uniref:Uncharacterized protein n=1 Tax=Pseudoalteromonas luteoviolacea TaxID=43657 RepID=A0A1C0TRN7_9GAMM|nr:hypothetical protein [Pseudoalteromonas luteoviolacea]OCQ21919.1 hypothetical protein A7985_08910 [Pseudoalteromonas luteoviolacea]